jgi:hypothetical protein
MRLAYPTVWSVAPTGSIAGYSAKTSHVAGYSKGHTATELAHVVGTSIERIKARQGNASPVRYFLDGIPPEQVASNE